MTRLLELEQIKKITFRPIVFQLGCVGFVGLILMQIISGMTIFSGMNRELQVYERHEQTHDKQERTTASVVLNASLFGDYVPKNINAAGVRQSMLNWTVVGVLVADNEEDSQVLLRKSNGHDEFFKVGDELPGGHVVKRVMQDGVLVLHDGVLERLSLPKDELNFEAPVEPLKED